MKSSAGDSEARSYEIAGMQAAGLERSKLMGKSIRAYGQMNAAGSPWTTIWAEHACLITDSPDGLSEVLLAFMQEHLLHWMEAFAIMKSYHVVIQSLSMLLKCIQKYQRAGELDHFVNDAHRFAQYFANAIEEHPLLICATALPFTPHGTLIYKAFYRRRLTRVVSGVEPTWKPLLQAMHGHGDAVVSAAFSPDGLKIVSGSNDNTVRVWDALTGKQLLSPLEGYDDWVTSVGFSVDGLKISPGSCAKTIQVWDALTGQKHPSTGEDFHAVGTTMQPHITQGTIWPSSQKTSIEKTHNVAHISLSG